MHVMKTLDSTGHTTTSWAPNVPAEVEAARIQFEAMTDKGYRAFRVEGGDRQGSRMEMFDPSAAEIMFVPQLKGG
jgi:hypothetical protein